MAVSIDWLFVVMFVVELQVCNSNPFEISYLQYWFTSPLGITALVQVGIIIDNICDITDSKLTTIKDQLKGIN